MTVRSRAYALPSVRKPASGVAEARPGRSFSADEAGSFSRPPGAQTLAVLKELPDGPGSRSEGAAGPLLAHLALCIRL